MFHIQTQARQLPDFNRTLGAVSNSKNQKTCLSKPCQLSEVPKDHASSATMRLFYKIGKKSFDIKEYYNNIT